MLYWEVPQTNSPYKGTGTPKSARSQPNYMTKT